MTLDALAHNLLLKLPPEPAHTIGKWAMKRRLFAPGRFHASESELDLFGFSLDNPLGLAAGFDKNGELVDQAPEYGFAYLEVGSITYHGGKGNLKPRLFRINGDSLLNRMGLNGDSAEEVIARLQQAHHPFALNIAKTHNPDIMGDKAIEDIVNTYKIVVQELEPLGKLIYIALNISCPNTREGKTFEEPHSLQELLMAVEKYKGARPIILKLSPTLTPEQVFHLLEIADDKVEWYICGNSFPINHSQHGKGGASGRLVRGYAFNLIKNVRAVSSKPIIACGGIFTGQDAYNSVVCGATAGFQAYTGFAYGSPYSGPLFVHKVNAEFLQLRKEVQM